jgi:alpha-L-fucosidase
LYLASRAIEALGVKAPSEAQLASEMARQFSVIARTAPSGVDADKWIDGAITKALNEYIDAD